MEVQDLGNDRFRVTVSSATKTNHVVTVSDADHQRLSNGQVSKEELLKASFAFLLKRESNTSILSSFSIMTIATYFPEYEGEIRATLS